jgi:RNase P subunit RPR2
MEIVKRGNPEGKTVERTCENCETIIRAKVSEFNKGGSHGVYLKCPICGWFIYY